MPNGQFWYGKSVGFPGFLVKKQLGVGARRSTRFFPGACASSTTTVFNEYRASNNGVGAQTIANRRAKNRLATICNPQHPCGKFYLTLGNAKQ